MLAVTGIGALIAFRLAYTFWQTADEETSGTLWYTICAVAIAAGLVLLWQAIGWMRRLRAGGAGS